MAGAGAHAGERERERVCFVWYTASLVRCSRYKVRPRLIGVDRVNRSQGVRAADVDPSLPRRVYGEQTGVH